MHDTFFTSDLHFFHKKILQLCPTTRKGSSLEEMHELIISKWNETVKVEDHVYILGDLSLGSPIKTLEILNKLEGNLHLIKGNHDHWVTPNTSQRFVEIVDYKSLKLNGVHLVMFHYPIAEHDRCHSGSYHLHGHTHGNYRVDGRVLDVGIDNLCQCDMGLWSCEDIVKYMEERPIIPPHMYPK